MLPIKRHIKFSLRPRPRHHRQLLRKRTEPTRHVRIRLRPCTRLRIRRELVLHVHHEAGRRAGEVVQQRPGDELVRRPGVIVGPEEQFVRDPGEQADGRVVHAVGEGLWAVRLHDVAALDNVGGVVEFLGHEFVEDARVDADVEALFGAVG